MFPINILDLVPPPTAAFVTVGSLSPRSVLFKIIVGDGTRGKRQGRGELFQEDEGITLVKDFERELGVSTTVVMAYFPLNMNSIYESKSYSSAAAADSRGNRGVVVIVSPACVVPLFRHPHNPLPSHHTSSSASSSPAPRPITSSSTPQPLLLVLPLIRLIIPSHHNYRRPFTPPPPTASPLPLCLLNPNKSRRQGEVIFLV